MQNLTSLKQHSNGTVENKALDKTGLGMIGRAQFTFDCSGVDNAGVSNKTQAAHTTNCLMPANAIIIGGNYEVNVPFTSTNSTSTIAIHAEAANDIVTATAVSNAIYKATGRKVIIPKITTVESTSIKCTVARRITCTVGVEALLTGKLTGWLFYVVTANTPAT